MVVQLSKRDGFHAINVHKKCTQRECEQAAPEVFGLDDDGFVTVLLDDIPDALAEKAEAATRACPVAALRTGR
jgi:ferredoxin